MSSRAANRRSTRGEYIETVGTISFHLTFEETIREPLPPSELIITKLIIRSSQDTGNKISRRAKIEGTPHIILGGRVVVQADVCLRGDLCRLPNDATEVKDNMRTAINIGKYTLLSTGATIHPPHRVFRGGEITYYHMRIGENVFVGANSFVSAASIGSYVHVGKDVVIENGCIIKDCVKVLDGSVLAAGMVVPSGVIVGGSPAVILGDLPDAWGVSSGTVQEGEWVEGGELRELIRSVR